MNIKKHLERGLLEHMTIICNVEIGHNLSDLTKFFKAVDTCHGSVKLSQYNLKSYISRYKALNELNNPFKFEIELSDPEDLEKLKEFNQERN